MCIYDVESFRLDGQERTPLLTDDERWKALILDRTTPITTSGLHFPARMTVQKTDGTFQRLPIELDDAAGTIALLPPWRDSIQAVREAGERMVGLLRFDFPEPGRMMLKGTLQGHTLEATLVRRNLEEMHLISRGFRWINELPFNR